MSLEDKNIQELGYRLITTNDQSLTLWSEHFQESCHSQQGAIAETNYVYVEGCQVHLRSHQGPLSILEIGHGLGHGVIQTLNLFTNEKSIYPVHVVSTELDENLIRWSIGYHKEGGPNVPSYRELKRFSKLGLNYYQAEKENLTLTILIGDARETLPLFKEQENRSFDCVYQDAFSPKKCPELWSLEWFKLLKSMSKHNAVLSTYSASNQVSKALSQSGWRVEKRSGFAGKRESIRAYNDLESP